MANLILKDDVDPGAPAAGFKQIYAEAGGIYAEDESGNTVNLLALSPGGLTPYTVGPGETYTTIQSAIDQAVTDGATHANPALVLVKHNSTGYVEDITLAKGVHIVAFGNSATHFMDFRARGTSGPTLLGKIQIPDLFPPAGGSFPGDQISMLVGNNYASNLVSGLSVISEDDYCIEVTEASSGIGPSSAVFHNCTFYSYGAVTGVINMPDTYWCWVGMRDCVLSSDLDTVGGIIGSLATLSVWGGAIISEPNDGIALTLDDGYVELHGCNVWGQIYATSTSLMIAEDTSFVLEPGATTYDSAIRIDAASTVELRGCRVSGPTYGVEGTGVLIYDELGEANVFFGPGTAVLDPSLSITGGLWDAFYSPAVSADWLNAPTSVVEALDELASKVKSYPMRVVDTGATVGAASTDIAVTGLDDDTVYEVEARVVGRTTSGTYENCAYKLFGMAHREAAGAAVLTGAVALGTAESAGGGGLDATLAVSGNDVKVTVTGVLGSDLNWRVVLELVPIT